MPLTRLAKDVMGYSEIVFFRFAAFLFLHMRCCATCVLFA